MDGPGFTEAVEAAARSEKLLAAIEAVGNPTLDQCDLPVILRTYTAMGHEAPTVLRRLADELEADGDLCLIGLWSTGFGEPFELVIQAVIELDPARSAYPSPSPETATR